MKDKALIPTVATLAVAVVAVGAVLAGHYGESRAPRAPAAASLSQEVVKAPPLAASQQAVPATQVMGHGPAAGEGDDGARR